MEKETLLRQLKEKSEESYEHSLRVGLLMQKLALKMGKEASLYRIAGELHDIGKLQIKTSILEAPRKLSEIEVKEMQRHSTYGSAILSVYGDKLIYDAAKYHHLEFRGGGYPECKLSREAIPEVARMVAICDVYDALSSKRSYKESLGNEDVRRIMDEMLLDGKFDPRIYRVFWNSIALRKVA